MHVSNDRLGPSLQDSWRDVGGPRSKHVAMWNRQRFLQACRWWHRDGRHVPSGATGAVRPQKAEGAGEVKPPLSTPPCLTSEVLRSGVCHNVSGFYLCGLLSTLAAFCSQWAGSFPFSKISKSPNMSSNVNHWLKAVQSIRLNYHTAAQCSRFKGMNRVIALVVIFGVIYVLHLVIISEYKASLSKRFRAG